MFFASDNAGPVHPQIMAALTAGNDGYAMPYGNDAATARAVAQIRDLFEAPEAEVFLVTTGTAANALALSLLCAPWQTVFCSPVAHIHMDECNAPEFFAGGAKLTLVPGEDRMTPEALRTAIAAEQTRGVHGPQRGPVSITQVTECGGVYGLDELAALCDVARSFECPVHMDGARFANALARLDCSPAEMTWKAGVDVLSFGATKNGAMGVEAVVLFDPARGAEFELRRKRGAHLMSKHRYLAVQMNAYLENGVWLEMAQAANAAAARLADELVAQGAELLHPVEANVIFTAFPRAVHQRLHEAGAQYYVWSGDLNGDDPEEMLAARLVCDWSVKTSAISEFLALF